jgi:5-methyltetrahydrofolate--homocysteine methyltransferase
MPDLVSFSMPLTTALLTLKTIRKIQANFPTTHTICGVSNVSMGLPGRRLINRTFLVMAIAAGLDTLMIDVRDQVLMSSIYASKVLMDQDSYCLQYLQAYRERRILFKKGITTPLLTI